ncbi:MAG: hypothetical protein H6817_07665 [Phycisphaerales bacterium]|nr:hypothetical protein [Phycisphaerales bacterium]
MRINDLIDPPRVDICDTNAFFLGSALLDGMYDGTFEVISCDSASGILQISGGPYHEGEIVLGVGNLDWTAIAEGYCVLPRIDPCGTSMDVEIESITASTIDAGQSGPPYATSPFDSGALSLLPLIWEVQGLPCFHGDVNCDGAVNAGDIGIVASGSNFGQASPACDRADVDGSGGPINAGDIGEIANAAIFGSNIGIYCCCQTPTPDACGIPWAPSVASLTAMPGARLTSAANDAK